MFETIRKRYLIRYTFYTFLSWGFLILIIVASRKDIGALITMYTKEAVDIYDLNESQIRDGIHVEGEIVTPLGIYAYQERGGEKREIQFFILAGQNQIIGIDCKGDVKDDLQRNQTAFEAAYGEKENPLDGLTPVKVQGILRRLEGEPLALFNECIDSLNLSDMDKAKFLPYVVMEGRFGDADVFSLVLIIFLALSFLIGNFYYLLGGIRGKNMKSLTEYWEAYGGVETGMRQMEEFYYRAPAVYGLRIDEPFFLMIAKDVVYFAETEDILWVYGHVLSRRMNFVLVNKTYSLKVKKADGKEFSIPVPKEENALEMILAYIQMQMPYVVLGYDKETEKLYKHNRYQLIRMVEQRREDYLDTRGREINHYEEVIDSGYQEKEYDV